MFEQNIPLPKNDPALFAPTTCTVLKSFWLNRQEMAVVGTVVTLPFHDATSLAALGRVELL